jgi:hypothetical protein
MAETRRSETEGSETGRQQQWSVANAELCWPWGDERE